MFGQETPIFFLIFESYDLIDYYHEIRERGKELGDLANAGALIDESVAMSVQHNLLQMFKIGVVDQGAEISPVWRRNWKRKERKEKGRLGKSAFIQRD